MRAAASTRASRSRPAWSVPNGCAQDGGRSVSNSEIVFGPGLITGASSASTTMVAKIRVRRHPILDTRPLAPRAALGAMTSDSW